MNKEEIKSQIQQYIEQGLLKEAEQAILQYKKNIGYDDEIASMEAILSIYSGNYDEALNYLKVGLKNNIFNSDLYFTMGNIHEIKEEYNKAYLCYEHALSCSKKDNNKNLIIEAMDNLKRNFNVDVNNYSIIILTYNQLDYTKVCIDSIKKYNGKENCEIVITDNNSTDGTVEWIKQQQGIKYILNEENKGFPAGCNQGIEIAEKNNDIFLLNNDTVIMPNSIFNLRMGLYSDEKIGATGAVSNSISYYQQISESYEDFDEYMKFAVNNNITNEASYEERIKIVGFAMIIKRNVLDKVGLLDERFTPGNFEDDDISFRILMEGYKLLLCRDSYIHHFGSVSFKEDSKKYGELLKTNSNKFKEKWGFVSEYSTAIRTDMVELMHKHRNEPINVLEVGCGCGATLLFIKDKYPNSNIYGIELNENSAKIAKCFADVRGEEIENSDLSYEKGYFDYIILGDVLECLYNPQEVLENMKKYLKDDGCILASISNVMHHSVIKQLINGSWTYEKTGILNKANIRFFTKSEIIRTFSNSGYKDIIIGSVSGYTSNEDRNFIEQISKLSITPVKEEFETYRYLVRAKNYSIKNEQIEKKCTFLIRRLEFDMDVEESINELIEYIKDNLINYNQIMNIVAKDVINKVYVLNFIAIKCFENELFDNVITLLNSAYDIAPKDLDTNYNLAYVLNMIGEKTLAIEYLNNLDITNKSIEELKVVIGGND